MFAPYRLEVQCPKCQRKGKIVIDDFDESRDEISCQCTKCKANFCTPSPYPTPKSEKIKIDEKELSERLKKWEEKLPKDWQSSRDCDTQSTRPIHKF